MWYPIDGTDLPRSPIPGGNNVPISIKPEDAPGAADLKDWIQTEKDLSIDESLSLGFAPFSLNQSGNHRTIVLDAMRYADKDNIRWGVGVRFVLHAWTEKGDIKGSVALVAAQASLNLAYTRTTVQVLGYQPADLAKLLPGFEEMSVSNYADLMKALDAVRTDVLGADPANLTPRPIAVSVTIPPPVDKQHHWVFHFHHS
jgi:hypothetical protein